MKRTNLTRALSVALTAALFVTVAAVYAQSGGATLMVVNYVGNELSFTLDGALHAVPASDGVRPGQVSFDLSAGKYEYSGVVPGGPGANGMVELASGQSFVLGARLDKTAPRVSPEGKVIEEPRDVLVFFEASLTPPSPPAVATRAPLRALPAGQGALVFENYIGEELVLDVQGTIYRVAVEGRLQLDLPPGEYAYSASAGVSGTSGTATVVAGQYTGLGFSREVLPQPTYEKGRPEPTKAVPKLLVSAVDLSAETPE